MRRLLLATAMTLGLLAATPHAAEAAKPRHKVVAGHYVGSETPEEPNGLDDIVFTFDVAKKGRVIKKFTIAMNVVCSGYPIYVEYVVQPMHAMRINPRTGRFHDVVRGTTDGGTGYEVAVSGRIKRSRVTQGTMYYDVGICQRGSREDPMRWVAHRGR
ncbi:hypothetical protein D9V37_04645 [Nocardioides mangrovicus]|uniref:Uncharacterized protein n=1 Tax=Nocardioides mangrovicus TaxID=2478913 RepID=A0A3L8P5D0_9ACTN|nr:hypothetical protein [Nocardioides mangrovicus]RLV50344.1 hypothetical protein D9V37_04645 [Nocardioides mangrovicus]